MVFLLFYFSFVFHWVNKKSNTLILCAGENISDKEIGKVGSGERDHVPLRGTRANECYPLSSTVFTHGHNQRDDAFIKL